MGYNPNEPRDMHGKWTDGSGPRSSKGNKSLIDRISTQHQREAALAIAKGAAIGVAQGVVASAVIGVATGGLGTPAVIALRAIQGARAGLHPVLSGISAVAGGYSGLDAHREKMKSTLAKQHKGK